MNAKLFLADQERYFGHSYDQFVLFGGPCVYFHRECIAAGETEFLSNRHLEMLYATLTAWGMHRMGDNETKLTSWELFRDSLLKCGDALQPLRQLSMVDLSESDYSDAVSALAPCYKQLRLSTSGATIVVNSKALYHLLPRLIPPIDRQYTIRFFQYSSDQWRGVKGNFRTITLPKGMESQFKLFHTICMNVKRLAEQVDRARLDHELQSNGVTAPKAIDNAIVNYVRLRSIAP